MNIMNGFIVEDSIRLLARYMREPQKKPTLYHSLRVGAQLFYDKHSFDIQIAGILHDALEDTEMSESEILESFNQHVLDIVKANSKNKDIPQEDVLEDIVMRCAQVGDDAIIVKIADVYDNFEYYQGIDHIAEIDRCKAIMNFVVTHSPSFRDDSKVKKVIAF